MDLAAICEIEPNFGKEVRPACQLYLISPPAISNDIPNRLYRAFEGGPIAAFQLRIKDASEHDIARFAEPIQKLCSNHQCAFIVNDSISLAKRLGADGVHLGQSDGDPRDARQILGKDAQIGVTCHNSRHLAMEAGDAGADYVAFGAFYPTTTKKTEYVAEPRILNWWTGITGVPCVAIGGITPQNAPPLIAAGADFIAVSSAVWNDPRGEDAAIRDFNALF